MPRFPRPGLAAAAALALLAPAAPAADPDKLLPADADIVLSVNVRQLVGSEVVKQYALGQLKDALAGQDAQKLLTDLGLDPFKDIDRVTVGGTGKDAADMKFLAVVRGKFDPAKLTAAARKQAKDDPDHFRAVKDSGGKVFQYTPDSGSPVYAAVVDDGAVVLGSDPKLVAGAAASAAAGLSPAVAALVKKMDDRAAVWVVAVVKDKLGELPIPGGFGNNPAVKKQLGNIDAVSAVIRTTEDVTMEIALGMRDEAAAAETGKSVADLLQTLKGALPLLIGGQPQLKPLVQEAKSLASKVADKDVVITGKLTGAAIGKLLNPEN